MGGRGIYTTSGDASLYAEDEALMPADAMYEQNYKVSGIFERLRQDAADYPDTMEQRYGAWAGLMSL
jgi:hypothetical protein